MPDSFISNFINSNKDQLPQPLTNSEDLVIPIKKDDVLTAFYDSVLPYFSSPSKPSEKLIELKFNELLLHILNNPENKELICYMHEVASQKTNVMEQVMETNFSYNLELEDFANLCNRSLSSFKRDFENSYKTTPGRWLLAKRLDLAIQLIKTTNKSLSDIILESGFENQAHFSRVFKAKFGYSPLQFRKQLESST